MTRWALARPYRQFLYSATLRSSESHLDHFVRTHIPDCFVAFLSIHLRMSLQPLLPAFLIRYAVVLCPLSVTDGWLSEFSKFCPSLSVLQYVGDKVHRRDLRTTLYEHVHKTSSHSNVRHSVFFLVGGVWGRIFYS